MGSKRPIATLDHPQGFGPSAVPRITYMGVVIAAFPARQSTPSVTTVGRFTDSTGDNVGRAPGDREHDVRALIKRSPDRRVTKPFGNHLRMKVVRVVCAEMLPCTVWSCAPGARSDSSKRPKTAPLLDFSRGRWGLEAVQAQVRR
jgi:hypothetical protein